VTILAGLVLVAVVVRRRGLTLGLAAALAALAVALIAPPLSSEGALRSPFSSRYLHPGGVVCLWLVAELIAAGRPWPRWTRPAAAFAAAAWLVFALVPNIGELRDRAELQARGADVLRAELRALEIAREVEGSRAAEQATIQAALSSVVALAQRQGSVGPRPAKLIANGAAAYFDVAADYGTPAMTTRELLDTPAVYRQQADLVLGNALPLTATPATPPPELADEARRAPASPNPELEAGSCSVFGVSPEPLPAQPPPDPDGGAPPVSRVTGPAGGVWIDPAGADDAALRIGLFADEPSFPLVVAGDGAEVALPEVAAEGRPWRLIFYGERPVTVCAS
jgi:hypothetical protein